MLDIIDTHLHVFETDRPDRPRREPPQRAAPDPHPIEMLLPVLERNHVRMAIQVNPIHMGDDNTYSIEVAHRLPDRIAVMARVEVQSPEIRDTVRRLAETDGVAGVRLTMFRQGAADALRAGRLDPFWDAVNEAGLPVAIYAPEALDGVLAAIGRFPDTRLIIDHLGVAVHPGAPDPFVALPLVREFAEFSGVRIKLAGLPEVSTEGFPFADVHNVVAQVKEWYGAERIMWGTDYPIVTRKCTYEEALTFVTEGCDFLTAEDLTWIMGRTAREFLSLGPPPPSAESERGARTSCATHER